MQELDKFEIFKNFGVPQGSNCGSLFLTIKFFNFNFLLADFICILKTCFNHFFIAAVCIFNEEKNDSKTKKMKNKQNKIQIFKIEVFLKIPGHLCF